MLRMLLGHLVITTRMDRIFKPRMTKGRTDLLQMFNLSTTQDKMRW